MGYNLRKDLAKSQIAQRQSYSGPYDPDKWAKTVRELQANGGRYPELRFPIVIGGRSVISSPEQLQQLAEIPEVPAVITTHEVEFMTYEPVIPEGRTEPEEVKICDVNLAQLEMVQRKTEWKKKPGYDRQIWRWLQDRKGFRHSFGRPVCQGR